MSSSGDDPYEVGYRKPPKSTQFKPGKSGNPKGRKARNVSVSQVIRDQLHKKVTLSNGSTSTVIELIVAQGVKDLASGHVRQWPQTFAFLEQFNPKQKFVPSADDQERLERLIAEMSKPECDNGQT